MELPPNSEQHILNKCGWTTKNMEYFGVLIYNISTKDDKPIADIISKRDADGIKVDWFIPNQAGEKISLVYDSKTNSIVTEKSDAEIKNNADLNAFLDTIENTIKNQKGDFLPKAKIEQTQKTKLTV